MRHKQDSIDRYKSVLTKLLTELDSITFMEFKNSVFCKKNHVHTNFFLCVVSLGYIESIKIGSTKMYRSKLKANEVEPIHARRILEILFKTKEPQKVELEPDVLEAVQIIKKFGYSIKLTKLFEINL